MKLHTLRPAKGAVHSKTRLGRGNSSGKGGTSTKGTKGHQSRSGFKYKWAHEGGQMPLQRRLPKRGFTNPFRVGYRVFNLGQIDELVKKYSLAEFSVDALRDKKLIHRGDRVKILAKGGVEANVCYKIHSISTKARQILEQKGCRVDIVGSAQGV